MLREEGLNRTRIVPASKDIHERLGYRYTDAEWAEWAPRCAPWPATLRKPTGCSTTATSITPRSTPSSLPPRSRPDAHWVPRLHRNEFFIGAHIYTRSECSLTFSRPCQRSLRRLFHLPGRKSERRLFVAM